MPVNKRIGFVLRVLAVLVLASMSFSCSGDKEQEFKLEPKKAPETARVDSSSVASFEVGTGWANGKPEEAMPAALAMALQGKERKKPDFMIIHPTAGSDTEKLLQEARKIVGSKTKIYGGTSDARGVFSDRGYVMGAKRGYKAAKEDIDVGLHGVVVMTISTKDIDFGVGSASLSDHASALEMSKAALQEAILNAGKDLSQKPAIILITPTIGTEHKALEGVRELVGIDTVLLGGTAGGPNGQAIGNDQAYGKGVSFAVFYTDLPIGWVFESGFEKPDQFSGVVTKMDGRRIVEIDHKPAYEVYDGWLGGEVTRLRQQGEKSDELRDFLSLHPLFRKRVSPDGTSYNVFSHPWAPNKDLITNGLNTTTDIKVGERVYLSYGTWEVLLNRIGRLPEDARSSNGGFTDKTQVLMSLGTICGGVMGVIPEEERKKFPALINYTNNKVPFIASFTWGEQGHLPGVGYQHSNLTTSFLVIGDKR